MSIGSRSNPTAHAATSTWGRGLAQETPRKVLTYQSHVTVVVPAKGARAKEESVACLVNCRISLPAVILDTWGKETLFKRKEETLQAAEKGIIPKLAQELPSYANELSNCPAAREFRVIPVASYEHLC